MFVLVFFFVVYFLVSAVQAGGDGHDAGGVSPHGAPRGHGAAGEPDRRRHALLHGQTVRHRRVLQSESSSAESLPLLALRQTFRDESFRPVEL